MPNRKFFSSQQVGFNFTKDLVVLLDASDPASFTTFDEDSNGLLHVQTWNDKSGNGNHFVRGNTNHGAQYEPALFGGKGGMYFNAGGVESAISAAVITPATYMDNMTIVYVMRKLKAYDGPILTNDNAGTNEYITWFTDAGTMGQPWPASGVCGPMPPMNSDMIYTEVRANSTTTHRYIGTDGPSDPYIGVAGGYASQVGKLSLGEDPKNLFGSDFKLGLFLVYKRAFTATEVAQLISHINNSRGWNIAQPAKPYNFVLDGNSLVRSEAITEDVWPVKLPKLMSISQYNFTMAGIGGQTLTDMISRAAANVDAYYDSSYAANERVVLAWEITNELIKLDATPSSVQALLQTYCDARRAVGWKVILGTCLPRTTGKAGFEADRQTINQWIRDNQATLCDGIADLGANGNGIGSSGDELGANYLGDGTHLSAPGHLIAAGIWQTALNAAIA